MEKALIFIYLHLKKFILFCVFLQLLRTWSSIASSSDTYLFIGIKQHCNVSIEFKTSGPDDIPGGFWAYSLPLALHNFFLCLQSFPLFPRLSIFQNMTGCHRLLRFHLILSHHQIDWSIRQYWKQANKIFLKII